MPKSSLVVYITPLNGMLAAQEQVERSASRIASFPAAGPDGDTVDLSTEMISLIQARNSFAANVKAQTVMDKIAQDALNLVG